MLASAFVRDGLVCPLRHWSYRERNAILIRGDYSTPTSQYEDAYPVGKPFNSFKAVVVKIAVEAPKIADTLYNTGLISIIAALLKKCSLTFMDCTATAPAAAYPLCRTQVVKQITKLLALKKMQLLTGVCSGSDMR